MHQLLGKDEKTQQKSTKFLSSSSSSSTTLEFIEVSDFQGASWIIIAAPASAGADTGADTGAAPASATAGGGFGEALELRTWTAALQLWK